MRGGSREGAGRKSIADKDRAVNVMVRALKAIYNQEEEEDAKQAFVMTLMKSERGRIFIAEHVFGKPTETINNNFSIADNFDITKIYDPKKT